jgi:hypothetical protein
MARGSRASPGAPLEGDGGTGWPIVFRCISPPAAIGPCTLADRSVPVHCLGTVVSINAIYARVRFVIHPPSNSPPYRHEGHFSPRKFYAPLASAIKRSGRASTFFFAGSPAAFRPDKASRDGDLLPMMSIWASTGAKGLGKLSVVNSQSCRRVNERD